MGLDAQNRSFKLLKLTVDPFSQEIISRLSVFFSLNLCTVDVLELDDWL